MSQLSGSPHLVCATAGNFGQGMAYAARKRGLPITIFVGAHANPMKVDRMRQLGATVRAGSDDPDVLHAEAESFAREHGAHLVQDGREAAIAEGAGTIAIRVAALAEVLRRYRRTARRRRAPRRNGAMGQSTMPDDTNDRRLRDSVARDGTLVAYWARP